MKTTKNDNSNENNKSIKTIKIEGYINNQKRNKDEQNSNKIQILFNYIDNEYMPFLEKKFKEFKIFSDQYRIKIL